MMKTQGIKESKQAQGIYNPLKGRLLTIKGAAQYLGLTIWAMRERVWAGQIPIVRFDRGRKIYIDRQDLEQFIERHKTTI